MSWNTSLLRTQHRSFLAANQQIIQKSLLDGHQHAKRWVQTKADFKRRSSSSLKDDTRWRLLPLSSGARLRLYWPREYARFVEYGTRGPYWITARRAKALRFVAGGQVLFRRRVKHPGIRRPRKFGWKSSFSAFRVIGNLLRSRMTALAARS